MSTYIVSLKAFGDFVIASRCASRIAPLQSGKELQLLAGEHLLELVQALDVQAKVKLLPTGPKLPAAFDVRQQGLFSALRSLYNLKVTFRSLPKDAELIFDRLGIRELVLCAAHRRKVQLHRAPNIYLAFEQTLSALGFTLSAPDAERSRTSGATEPLISIIPSSRVMHKRVPGAVILSAVAELQHYGRCEVVEIAGEAGDVPPNLNSRRIPRTFKSLIDTIAASDLVISADSLSAHLAEYIGVPTFVLTPRPNEYWLPRIAFRDHAWSLFHDQQRLGQWLKQHFALG